MTYYEVIKKALFMFYHRDEYAYFYGAKGQVLTDDGAEKTTPLLGTEGNGLYTSFGGEGRHVGIDIGYGFFLHMPKEGHTIELGRIAEYDWEHSFHFANINYEGAKA